MEEFICSICGEKPQTEEIAMKWNQNLKKGWCLCIGCKDKYRGDQTHKNKIEKDSYNYFTTTIRQLLVRHGFALSERTVGSLRLENYVKWNLRATAPNEYFIKVNLDIERRDVKDYTYFWTMKTYDPEGNYVKQAECDKPNVPMVKDFLNDFLKHIGSNPYQYFRSTLKSVIAKHKLVIMESSETDDLSAYKGMFTNNQYRWEAQVEKDFKWNVKLIALKGKAKVVEEHDGGTFAISPLKEFFNKIAKKY
jgi:hypothetical protein